jgi:ribonuclease HI
LRTELKLKKDFPTIKMKLIPREDSQTCDKLAKKAIRDAVKTLKIKPKDKNIGKPQTLFTNENN